MDVSRETPDVTTKPNCYDLANIVVRPICQSISRRAPGTIFDPVALDCPNVKCQHEWSDERQECLLARVWKMGKGDSVCKGGDAARHRYPTPRAARSPTGVRKTNARPRERIREKMSPPGAERSTGKPTKQAQQGIRA